MPLSTSVYLAVLRREPAAEIDHAQHIPRDWINAHDNIGGPDVRENFAFHIFQVVQTVDGTAMVQHSDGAFDLEGDRIEKPDLRGAIAEDERLAVGREAPALAGIGKFFFLIKSFEVIDKPFLVLPGQLKQLAVQERQPLGKVFARNIQLFQHRAGREIHLPQTGLAVQPGAFIQSAVEIEQALRECAVIVGKGVDDFIGVNRRGRGNGGMDGARSLGRRRDG